MYLKKENIATFKVRVGDINYGGHLGNDKALLLFHDARIKFLESMGFSEKHIGDGIGIIMSDAHVFFKKEVFLHDKLSADVSVEEVTTSSFTLLYSIKRLPDKLEVINGTTRLIAFDYEKRKVVRIPTDFMDRITI